MTIQNILKNNLQKQLKSGKTLVYFASGTKIRREYRKLPYENVILVDSSFRSQTLRSDLRRPKLFVEDGIICLGMDALHAVFLLKELHWQIDCVVSLNEGLYEGGGHYAVNGDAFLGYLFPILPPEFIHIGYKDYYSGSEYHHLKEHWLDIPYKEKRVLTLHDHNYISPAIFTDSERYAKNAEVTHLSIKSTKTKTIKCNGKILQLRHDSIWSGIPSLDAAFLRFENEYQKNIAFDLEQKTSEKPFIFPVHTNKSETYTTYDIDEIISLSNTNKWEHIGLVPNRGNYDKLRTLLFQSDAKYPKKITMYHLNANDFSELYNAS